ncbi:hypothetical protein HU200_043476 [Digitaria exilis]|uniref:Uncharacterized protein n=1 Tax=Digitaria exilis TaxID=1010633 RepID=A0A835B8W5_9POAL|nr:hypothetical protein HU200_043476 [Digitaria exilis]
MWSRVPSVNFASTLRKTATTSSLDVPSQQQHGPSLLSPPFECAVARLWTVPRPASIPERHFDSFILLVCWQLWKRRNAIIFEGVTTSITSFWSIEA